MHSSGALFLSIALCSVAASPRSLSMFTAVRGALSTRLEIRIGICAILHRDSCQRPCMLTNTILTAWAWMRAAAALSISLLLGMSRMGSSILVGVRMDAEREGASEPGILYLAARLHCQSCPSCDLAPITVGTNSRGIKTDREGSNIRRPLD